MGKQFREAYAVSIATSVEAICFVVVCCFSIFLTFDNGVVSAPVQEYPDVIAAIHLVPLCTRTMQNTGEKDASVICAEGRS